MNESKKKSINPKIKKKTEPLPADSPLWDLENAVLSPHNADLVEDFIRDSVLTFVERYEEYRGREVFSQLVDKESGY
jgi:phosphoglycerate dehydrogenase-like enzyme